MGIQLTFACNRLMDSELEKEAKVD
jgi:hypothetical protein